MLEFQHIEGGHAWALKNWKITGWQNVNEGIHSLYILGFVKRISLKLFGISGSNFQR